MLLPDPEIAPALALQATALFEVPETLAVNVCDPPAAMLAVPGEIDTETVALPGPGEDAGAGPLLPQLESIVREMVTSAASHARGTGLPSK